MLALALNFMCTLSFAQYNNKLSVDLGEKYLTDWRARYSFEYGASYTHVFFKHYYIKANITDYYANILNYITDVTSPYGFPLVRRLYQKKYLEWDISIGYFLYADKLKTKFKFRSRINA